MLTWIPIGLMALILGGFWVRHTVRKRKERRIAARRVIERPNSYYASESVRNQEDAEWWAKIDMERLHPVNRDYVDRLLVKVRSAGVDSLNRDERAFLERMANLEAPPRMGLRPEQNPWPFPA